MEIHKAEAADIPQIAAIYLKIHDREQAGLAHTGWLRGIYPVHATAEAALRRADLYVGTEDGRVVGSAIFNHVQMDSYREGAWAYPAAEDQVLVMHTLTIDPDLNGRGFGRQFVLFYERLARETGCTVLRIDTQAKNTAARAMYAKHGYREAGIIPCDFNGIPDVRLVLLEKPVV